MRAIKDPIFADNVAFLGVQDGVLQLAVRSPIWVRMAEECLANQPLASFFPGCTRATVRVDSAGQTGRERRGAVNEKRRQEAQVAAERSPVIRTLLTVFEARLEDVEAPRLTAAQDNEFLYEEKDDEG